MMMLLVLLSLLFWSLLETQSQTVSSPYLSFKGKNLSNNSYVDIREIGMAGNGSDSVQCISVLQNCCNDSSRTFLADWYFPNGSYLQFGDGIRESTELTCVAITWPIHQLAYIAVKFPSMSVTPEQERCCVWEYT